MGLHKHLNPIYTGVKKECDSVQNFIEMKSNQKYYKMYPIKIQNIPLCRKKSNISSDSLSSQQLAVIVEELSRNVLLSTQLDFFQFFLCIIPKLFQGLRMFLQMFSFRTLHKFSIMLRSGALEMNLLKICLFCLRSYTLLS